MKHRRLSSLSSAAEAVWLMLWGRRCPKCGRRFWRGRLDRGEVMVCRKCFWK